MKTFYALEPHVDGTTKYAPGDKREADENEVKHLIDLKVLGTEPPAKEKAEGAAPANKAEGKPANKAG
ncbi:hypothetical protein MOP88_13955 [Sphingomonas sp. WKB10]|nr:hypothetical protein [Sphingomonas sp. WKB10]